MCNRNLTYSQWPGTVLFSASVGRSLMDTMPLISDHS
jgi:hypothetical protein